MQILNKYQKEQIEKGERTGVDVTKYNDMLLHHTTMYEIRKGLECGVDITPYLKSKMTFFQYREIRRALEHKIDPSRLLEQDYSSSQMKEIRLGLQARVDVSKYEDANMDYRKMMAKRHELINEKLNNSVAYYAIDKIDGQNTFGVFTKEGGQVVKLSHRSLVSLDEAKEHLSRALKVDNFYKRQIHIVGDIQGLEDVIKREKAVQNIKSKYPQLTVVNGYHILSQSDSHAFAYSPTEPQPFVFWSRKGDNYYWGVYKSKFTADVAREIAERELNLPQIKNILQNLDIDMSLKIKSKDEELGI